jgi:hypothetical protein
MFGTLLYSYDRVQLSNTLYSFHLMQAAVRKEECDGYRNSVPADATKCHFKTPYKIKKLIWFQKAFEIYQCF